MTTIACSRAMMAGDTRYCDGSLKGKVKTKIYRVNGDIIGYAGSPSEGMAFVEWYKDPSKEKPDISDTTFLVLRSDGTILHYDSSYHPLEINDFGCYAIGSGCDYAMGAMMAGKNPTEAVRIAAKLDIYSALPVRTLSL